MTPPTKLPLSEAEKARPNRSKRPLLQSGVFRLSVRRFLLALVLLLVATPFVEVMKQGQKVEIVLVTLVVCMGVFAVGARRRTLALAVVLVVPVVLASWAHLFWPERSLLAASFAFRLIFLTFVVTHLLTFIIRAPRVNSEVLCAGISIYLLLGVIWAIAYRLVADLNPEAFAFSVPSGSSNTMTPFNAVYFSYITLTTVGYGDVVPVSNVARMLAMTEAMTGTLFIGVLIARLVSLYSTPVTTEAMEGHPASLASANEKSYNSPSPKERAPGDR